MLEYGSGRSGHSALISFTSGRCVEKFFVSPGKGGIIFKTALVAGFCDGHAVLDQRSGPQQAFGGNIAGNTVSCLLLEQVHQVITAHKKTGGQQVNGNVLCQVLSDEIKYRKDFGVAAAVFYIGACVGIHGITVQMNKKFQKKRFPVQGGGKGVLSKRFFKLLQNLIQAALAKQLNAQYIGTAFLGLHKALVQGIRSIPAGIYECGGYVEDHPLVGGSAVDDRLMDLTGIYKDNIIGLQIKGFSLNVVGYIAPDENQDFVKIMIVIGKAVLLPVSDMKETEIVFQITGFTVRIQICSLLWNCFRLSIFCNVFNTMLIL